MGRSCSLLNARQGDAFNEPVRPLTHGHEPVQKDSQHEPAQSYDVTSSSVETRKLGNSMWKSRDFALAANSFGQAADKILQQRSQTDPGIDLMAAEMLLCQALAERDAHRVSIANVVQAPPSNVPRLLQQGLSLAREHEVAPVVFQPVRCNTVKANLLIAAFEQSLGRDCRERGHEQEAARHFGDAQVRLLEARAAWQTPRQHGQTWRAPRDAYADKLRFFWQPVDPTEGSGARPLSAETPTWWQRSGLDGNDVDAVLAGRLFPPDGVDDVTFAGRLDAHDVLRRGSMEMPAPDFYPDLASKRTGFRAAAQLGGGRLAVAEGTTVMMC